MTKISVKTIAENAIIAALYCAVTIAAAPLSYMGMQFRIAEILVLLVFWRPDFIFGLTLGCFLSNIPSSLGAWDMLFGTLATLISVVLIAYCSPRLWVACIYPIVINAFVVGAELYFILDLDFWLNVGLVAAGETTVIVGGYIIWFVLMKNRGFFAFLQPTKHQSVKY